MNTVFEKIAELLSNSRISFKSLQHEPTHTCEESAKARGESLNIGAKAILMKLDKSYSLFVLSAPKKIDSKKIKTITQCKSTRFATPEELFDLTSLLPGSVPPFGKPILPFELYIDYSIKNLPKVAFNAGSLTNSIILSTEDYLMVSHGILCEFSK